MVVAGEQMNGSPLMELQLGSGSHPKSSQLSSRAKLKSQLAARAHLSEGLCSIAISVLQ